VPTVGSARISATRCACSAVWDAIGEPGDRTALHAHRVALIRALPTVGTTSLDHALRSLVDAAMLGQPRDAANAMSWAYQVVVTHEAVRDAPVPWAANELVWHDQLVRIAEYREGVDAAAVVDPVEAALIREVNAAPDDAVTRRVYSDWLEQRSWMSKAEYLRIQCEVPAEFDIVFALSRLVPDLDRTWCAVVDRDSACSPRSREGSWSWPALPRSRYSVPRIAAAIATASVDTRVAVIMTSAAGTAAALGACTPARPARR
jgi:uncharacterized protein (TIGR02996 family)